jgi:hypothetical protein
LNYLFFRAVKRIQALVAEYEKAKKDEAERRLLYKNERNEIEEEISKLETRINASPEENTEDNEKMKQIEEQYKLISDKLQKQRLIMVFTIFNKFLFFFYRLF